MKTVITIIVIMLLGCAHYTSLDANGDQMKPWKYKPVGREFYDADAAGLPPADAMCPANDLL